MSNHFRDSNMRPAPPIVFKSDAPISVVCAAATYTGVTYANNGGKVQLSSAGVHGLTTSPAVGASVYVSWAGGTGVSGLSKIISVDDNSKITINTAYVAGLGTPTVALSNTSIEISSIILPPLSASSRIRLGARASFTASAATKSLFFSFGGVTDAASASTATATHNTLRLENGFIEIVGKTGATWDFIGSYITSPIGGASANYRDGTLSTLSGQQLKLLMKISAANEAISLRSYLVEVII